MTPRRTALVVLLAGFLALGLASPAAAREVKISASLVIATKDFSFLCAQCGPGGTPKTIENCAYMVVAQVAPVPGALSYRVVVKDGGGDRTVTPTSSVYNDYAIPTPAGVLWAGLTAGNGPPPCPAEPTLGGRFKIVSAVATLDDKLRISGTVRKADGKGASRVRISIKGPTSTTATTDASGFYSAVVKKGTYVVSTTANFCVAGAAKCVKSKKGVRPSATVDFGPPPRAKISGTVTGTTCSTTTCTLPRPLSGVVVRATGGSELGEDTTDVDGTYEIELPKGARYRVTPSLFGRTFDPASRSVRLKGPAPEIDFRSCIDQASHLSQPLRRITLLEGAPARAGQAVKGGAACRPDTLEWNMPERLTPKSPEVWKNGQYGLPSRTFITPKDWRVGLYMAKGDRRIGCNNLVRYKWEIDEKRLPKGAKVVSAPKALKGDGCAAEMRVSAQGPYHMTAAREEKIKGKWTKVGNPIPGVVKVKDWLVVAMGDSNGSGEGNWPFFYRRCARSDASYQFATARHLEFADPHSSVTFIFTSCSGASVAHLIDQQFAGTVPNKRQKLPEQLDQIGHLLTPIKDVDTNKEARKPDAAIVSIGVNNLGFGAVLKYCILQGFKSIPCQDAPATIHDDGAGGLSSIDAAPSGKTLRGHLNSLQRKLPGRYRQLALAFKRDIAREDSGLGGLKPNRIFMSHYPNFSRGDDGKPCDTRPRPEESGPGFPSVPVISSVPLWGPDTWSWLGASGVQLNKNVSDAAGQYGWTAVPLSDALFEKRGYCAVNSLFVGVAEAKRNDDETGPFHPRRVAHDINADATYRQLCRRLYGKADCHD